MKPGQLPEDGYALMSLSGEFEGSCPCSTFVFEGFIYETHCWRICAKCDGCGLHYQPGAPIETVAAMRRLLTDMDLYGEWSVVSGLRMDAS